MDAEIPEREARSPERVPSEIAAGRHRQEDPSRSLGLASQRVTRRPEIRDGFLCLYLIPADLPGEIGQILARQLHWLESQFESEDGGVRKFLPHRHPSM